jgi:hypothetical protein
MEILHDGQIQVREARIIEDDTTGQEVARNFHRYVLDPGTEDGRTREVTDQRLSAVRDAVFTQDTVLAREDVLTRQREEREPR